MRDQYAMVENAGLENAGPICRGGKCRTMSMESLFANKCAKANVRMEKMTLVFSSFDTVVSNSCTICFVFTF